MSKVSEYISKVVVDWLEARKSSFIRDQLRGPQNFVVMDADTMKLLEALEQGRAARTTNYPDEATDA